MCYFCEHGKHLIKFKICTKCLCPTSIFVFAYVPWCSLMLSILYIGYIGYIMCYFCEHGKHLIKFKICTKCLCPTSIFVFAYVPWCSLMLSILFCYHST